ncbi:hypothetical protein BO78DRAFT_400039 [Aspergillus sclerotiicarbonarius CBS 121057]|uniref:Uncharacterized protein n=1 Tax=Aspergillus sclerotiicarbonarius (strain CBS 121057 / IBT 28362) TaxID=1448318 RepID=A0A319DZE0_ASPSB|nr:hypothetical protein BO78DRAFT_400039 [Aspergillus sclerotiicarbonarius CBS 121057]
MFTNEGKGAATVLRMPRIQAALPLGARPTTLPKTAGPTYSRCHQSASYELHCLLPQGTLTSLLVTNEW